jgi:hypothetical protein
MNPQSMQIQGREQPVAPANHVALTTRVGRAVRSASTARLRYVLSIVLYLVRAETYSEVAAVQHL